jgi:hypothetical protein
MLKLTAKLSTYTSKTETINKFKLRMLRRCREKVLCELSRETDADQGKPSIVITMDVRRSDPRPVQLDKD